MFYSQLAYVQPQRAVALTGAALIAVLALTSCADAPEAERPAEDAAAAAPAPRPAGLTEDDAAWELVAQGYVYTDSPVPGPSGELYFAAPIQNRIYRLNPDDSIDVFAEATAMAMGLTLGADGRIYGCSNRGARIVAYDLTGAVTTLYQGEVTPLPDKPNAPGEFCNDVAISAGGEIWYTDRVNRRVMHLAQDGTVREVAAGFRPNGTVLSADGTVLAVTDSLEPVLHAFQVGEGGALTEVPEYFPPVRMIKKLGEENVEGRPGTNGMTVDADGRFYMTSFYGIQVFAADGSYVGVIEKPAGFVSNLVFGGRERKTLYATGVNGIWRLAMQVQGPG